jgi:DNA-binding response OmpR family regulator
MQEHRSTTLVLIADDDPNNLDLVCSALAPEGLDIAVASDGEKVLKAVVREPPSLILLDALMPGLDGFETCRRLKADPATRDIPVMFMTALNDPSHRVKGLGAGAVDYITKPFEREELLSRVRTHLSLQSATRALKERNEQLSRKVEELAAAQRALTATAEELSHRTEELREANARLSQELRERESAEAARVAAEAERAALQDQVIAAQRQRLLELAAPLIPITDGILVFPLVGTIDGDRAEQALQTALLEASKRGAEYLIIDITGVKAVDGALARLLFEVSSGLGLLGTRAIITGMSPSIAQSFVQLDLRLDALFTEGTVQAAVKHALGAPSRKRSSRR